MCLCVPTRFLFLSCFLVSIPGLAQLGGLGRISLSVSLFFPVPLPVCGLLVGRSSFSFSVLWDTHLFSCNSPQLLLSGMGGPVRLHCPPPTLAALLLLSRGKGHCTGFLEVLHFAVAHAFFHWILILPHTVAPTILPSLGSIFFFQSTSLCVESAVTL